MIKKMMSLKSHCRETNIQNQFADNKTMFSDNSKTCYNHRKALFTLPLVSLV